MGACGKNLEIFSILLSITCEEATRRWFHGLTILTDAFLTDLSTKACISIVSNTRATHLQLKETQQKAHTSMGLFTSSPTSSPPQPKLSSDGTPIAPNRTERSKCWEGRDAYFSCLDRNNIVDSLKDSGAAEKLCGTESKAFEANCASSWVQYFKKRRVMEYQKEQTLIKLRNEGAQELPPGAVPGQPAGPR